MALTDAACRNFKPQEKTKKLADERGLYLLVKAASPEGTVSKYWRWDVCVRLSHLDMGRSQIA